MEKSTAIDSDTKVVTSPAQEPNSPEVLSDPEGNNGIEKEEDHKDKEIELSRDQGKSQNDKISRKNGTKSITSTNGIPATGSTGPQIFVVRPLPSRINQNSNLQDPSTSSEKNRVNNHSKPAQLRSIRGIFLSEICIDFFVLNISPFFKLMIRHFSF